MSHPASQPLFAAFGEPKPASKPKVDLLAALNEPQHAAVQHAGGPVLVVAGAGSGKTRVLTRRIAWLVAEQKVHPGSILAITFTNKAAAEMRNRVVDLVGNRAKLMWVSTFHSACVRILRQDISRFGFSKTFSIYDDTDSKRLMTLVLRELALDPKKFGVRAVMNWVSNCKNELVDHESARAKVSTVIEDGYLEVYQEYQRRLQAANALDFDDLIMTAVHLLQAFPEVRDHYRRRFRHVLVDEYQDTNHAQYALIRELCGTDPDRDQEGVSAPGLMVVGDSDQSIYAFRGATIRNILAFEEDFPGAETILLEQNYRSTQRILTAANGVIGQNEGRPPKRLWSDSGDGELIVGYVADTEHDEAQFIADEIDRLGDEGASTPGETAVFYRTNAQSRAFEDVFIRTGMPYKVVGGLRFYERREIRDAIGYLRAVANRSDDVSVRRILNVPKRGIGERAESAVAAFAAREQISFGDALRRHSEVPGLATRSAKQIGGFVELMDTHEALVADGVPADQVLTSLLTESGLLGELQASVDPQDQSRVENLIEFVSVAAEFVAAAHTEDLPRVGVADDGADEDAVANVSAEMAEGIELGDELAGAAPEPDDSLPAFLERIALVADADSIPDAGEGGGVVTLMTLHTAKGLEFNTVFLTGLEDGVFPHLRALNDPLELAEERRLAYVGITRARKRLYVSRAQVRTAWGAPQYNPASRFLAEIPGQLVDWRRLGGVTGWAASDSSGFGKSGRDQAWRNTVGFGSKPPAKKTIPSVSAGDRVLHTTFGMGTVIATSGSADTAKADVDFGSTGVKRLSLRHAPMEKL